MATTLLGAAVAAACAATLLGFLARWSWWGELACHFRPQYAVLLLAAAAGLVALEQRALALLAVAGGLVNLVLLLPLYVRRPCRRSAPSLRVLVANVWLKNEAYARLQRLVERERPDVFVLLETNSAWVVALKALAWEYPHAKAVAYLPGFGIMLCSRWPLTEARVMHFGGHGPPAIVATLDWQGRRVMVVGVHPLAPMRRSLQRRRNQQCLALAEFVRAQTLPVIVTGDFNATSWSPIFSQMLRRAGLRDSRLGFGLQPTWPAAWPWLRIPIDHCFLSAHWLVRRRWVGPRIGSDHLPVFTECHLA